MAVTFNNTQHGSTNQVDFISDSALVIIQVVNVSVLAGTVALFGIISNIFNIVVFLKQGLNDTVNIGLLALAVSDMCSMIALEWLGFLRNPLFCHIVPLIADEFQHLTGGWPHACFARITSWITVYITLERCLCVVIPLKIKRIITPRVTNIVLTSIFIIMFLSLVPDYTTCYIDWRFLPEKNRSMLGLVFLEGREQLAAMSFTLSAGTQFCSFGAVIIFTAILVIKMNQKSKWRQSASNYVSDKSKESNNREKRTVKMIILVAVIYCICFLPMLCDCIAISVIPGFIIFGTYSNSFFAAWSLTFLFNAINSSVNIIVYYKMSTKYRTTFDSLFHKKTMKF